MTSKLRIRFRIHEILSETKPGDKTSRIFDIGLITLIIFNIIAVILETEATVVQKYGQFLQRFEVFSVVIFTLEYLLRIWTCTSDKAYRGIFTGRARFVLKPMMLIDLLAILPFYCHGFAADLRIIRALRLVRLFRVLKIGRYSKALQTLSTVFIKKKGELGITLFVMLILLLLSSSAMYYIEHEVQPEAFPSILSAMWWGVVTLTTLGYGDVVPVTVMGKLMGAIIAFLGIGMFALPAAILASGFSEVIGKKADMTCPHCGKKIMQKGKQCGSADNE